MRIRRQTRNTDVASVTPSPVPAAPYSIFTRREKWILVGMVGAAGLFGPLPANIYFPAIPTLTAVFDRSVEDLNLTVTIYLAMQGLLSHALGLGLALCPPSAFWLLLLLRAVQSGGCASTIALGSGVIGDVAVDEERGGFFGMFNLGPMLAPCIGPAIGGALSQNLGWRSIFWFLVIFSSACFVMILLFLPETMRNLVGNGSIQPPGNLVYNAIVPLVATLNGKMTLVSLNPFKLLVFPDIVMTLTYTGIVYAVNYTITSTISSSFAATYPFLSETLLGICYLSTGIGMILGSTINGKLLDYDYARLKREHARHVQESGPLGDDGEVSFPVERARLRMVPLLLLVFVASVVGWGWCIQLKTSIAGPLVLQVILGYTSIAILNSTMTLMIDIIKNQSSGVIACTNLVRCSLAAMLVALIDRSVQRLGYGWTYTLLGGLCALLLLPVVLEIQKGPGWRHKRETINTKGV
ncbi:MFS general substrate transporter [Xylariomycetidae sp. FL2044]|nr:MFS general substrate transporter [Xylariomycetidae sp. FL2044]